MKPSNTFRLPFSITCSSSDRCVRPSRRSLGRTGAAMRCSHFLGSPKRLPSRTRRLPERRRLVRRVGALTPRRKRRGQEASPRRRSSRSASRRQVHRRFPLRLWHRPPRHRQPRRCLAPAPLLLRCSSNRLVCRSFLRQSSRSGSRGRPNHRRSPTLRLRTARTFPCHSSQDAAMC